jgi:5S rRNA maturation endonuclease (ribonuclease M5)
MKHLTLEGDLVFEIFTKVEKKKEMRLCKRLLHNEDVIITSDLEHYGEPIETEIDNQIVFNGYVYYYGGRKVYDRLKAIEFKFE